jgi:hypothetical protein
VVRKGFFAMFLGTVLLLAVPPRLLAQGGKPSPVGAGAVFEMHVKDYMALRQKLEAPLPALPRDATPQQIDAHQRALAARNKAARSQARPGEFFTPEVQALIRKTVEFVLSGSDGPAVKASIMDENPGVPKIVLNERYPSSVPLSTMPPQMLAPLPDLPKGLEYRFLGRRLILLDDAADIILDYSDNVIPA